ncbi:hypothetical protein KSP40_PGU005935 [Platanthera guangdongensis]|uniref:Uncharacterized protein n=1 Tax=Platanthera guangdongensis TaxID=2320717 RepID=A0ABR2MMV0_9ASPA
MTWAALIVALSPITLSEKYDILCASLNPFITSSEHSNRKSKPSEAIDSVSRWRDYEFDMRIRGSVDFKLGGTGTSQELYGFGKYLTSSTASGADFRPPFPDSCTQSEPDFRNKLAEEEALTRLFPRARTLPPVHEGKRTGNNSKQKFPARRQNRRFYSCTGTSAHEEQSSSRILSLIPTLWLASLYISATTDILHFWRLIRNGLRIPLDCLSSHLYVISLEFHLKGHIVVYSILSIESHFISKVSWRIPKELEPYSLNLL